MNIIFTLGHSTRSLSEFIALLKHAGATYLIDVRRFPRSPRQPHFNIENLPGHLARDGIRYLHLKDLGGRHPSFSHYADYAEMPAFRRAFERLLLCATDAAPAIMCAEADWRHCHRRFIADHLLAAGRDVRHIMTGKIEKARLSEGASIQNDRPVYSPLGDLPLFRQAQKNAADPVGPAAR